MKSPRLSTSSCLVVLGLLTMGCSSLPTSPVIAQRGVDDAGSRRSTVGPPDGGGRPETIDGEVGGEILAGPVRLWIPENAFSGRARIKMAVTQDQGLACDLKVTPASLQVTNPALLTFNVSQLDLAAMGVSPLQTLGVFRFDETLQRWMQVPATFDVANREITAEVSKFTLYKVDRADLERTSD